LASFTLAFALQLREKYGKPSVRIGETSVRVEVEQGTKALYYIIKQVGG
jgi:hypothetical protein